MVNNEQYKKEFTAPIIRIGRISQFIAIVLSFIPAIWLWWYFGLFPGWSSILNGWILVLSIFGVYAIVEPISYFPTLGLPGTYLSFLSGNISNMRVPASAIAQESLGVEEGTKKAELISTIGIVGSIILNIILITLGAFFGSTILQALPATIVEAFSYVSPAIFGAMFFMFVLRSFSIGIFAIVVALTLGFLGIFPEWLSILVCTFSSIFFGLWLYRREK